MVVGNGLTNSLLRHAKSALNSSEPFQWDTKTPGRDSLLMEDLPGLISYIARTNVDGKLSDFELIAGLVENLPDAPVPQDLPDEDQAALLDICHYLAVSYGWLQGELDGFDLSEWPWAKWIVANHSSLVGALSWNYDLTFERLLMHARTPYFYPGISGGADCANLVVIRPAIQISKPHGSTNFAIDESKIQIGAGNSQDGPFEELTYPRQIHITACDMPIRVLRREELFTVRKMADIVLPGEWNRFGQHLHWVRSMIDGFASTVQKSEHLLVVGFSMADCDEAEFLDAISTVDKFSLITIADPAPNPRLVKTLKSRAIKIVNWPDGPYGEEVNL